MVNIILVNFEKPSIRGAVGKYVAQSIISVTDLQTNTCLVSF